MGQASNKDRLSPICDYYQLLGSLISRAHFQLYVFGSTPNTKNDRNSTTANYIVKTMAHGRYVHSAEREGEMMIRAGQWESLYIGGVWVGVWVDSLFWCIVFFAPTL